jgi:hypothetical protein
LLQLILHPSTPTYHSLYHLHLAQHFSSYSKPFKIIYLAITYTLLNPASYSNMLHHSPHPWSTST